MLQKLTRMFFFRQVTLVVLVTFIGLIPAQSGFAQVVMPMPLPGEMIQITERLNPALMSGLRVNLKDPFNFYFIIDKAKQPMSAEVKKEEYGKIIKFFLSALTTPNDDMWVNLSPVESNRIMPDSLAQTEMGREMLAQDYLLKQLMSSLMYPEDQVGKEFWKQVYARAYEQFGMTDIPVDTFNKVWISADKADLFQKNDTVLLFGSHLKVMLEQDFMAGEANKAQFGNDTSVALPGEDAARARKITSDIVREVLVPIIEKEVNEGANFARVRQIYSAMIMATWFKNTLKQSLLGQVYADKSKVAGVEVSDPQAQEKIYEQYLETYKNGVFNYYKEEMDLGSQQVLPKKYFSGGMRQVSTDLAQARMTQPKVEAVLADQVAKGESVEKDTVMFSLKAIVANATVDIQSPLRDNQASYPTYTPRVLNEKAAVVGNLGRQVNRLLQSEDIKQIESFAGDTKDSVPVESLLRQVSGSTTKLDSAYQGVRAAKTALDQKIQEINSLPDISVSDENSDDEEGNVRIKSQTERIELAVNYAKAVKDYKAADDDFQDQVVALKPLMAKTEAGSGSPLAQVKSSLETVNTQASPYPALVEDTRMNLNDALQSVGTPNFERLLNDTPRITAGKTAASKPSVVARPTDLVGNVVRSVSDAGQWLSNNWNTVTGVKGIERTRNVGKRQSEAGQIQPVEAENNLVNVSARTNLKEKLQKAAVIAKSTVQDQDFQVTESSGRGGEFSSFVERILPSLGRPEIKTLDREINDAQEKVIKLLAVEQEKAVNATYPVAGSNKVAAEREYEMAQRDATAAGEKLFVLKTQRNAQVVPVENRRASLTKALSLQDRTYNEQVTPSMSQDVKKELKRKQEDVGRLTRSLVDTAIEADQVNEDFTQEFTQVEADLGTAKQERVVMLSPGSNVDRQTVEVQNLKIADLINQEAKLFAEKSVRLAEAQRKITVASDQLEHAAAGQGLYLAALKSLDIRDAEVKHGEVAGLMAEKHQILDQIQSTVAVEAQPLIARNNSGSQRDQSLVSVVTTTNKGERALRAKLDVVSEQLKKAQDERNSLLSAVTGNNSAARIDNKNVGGINLSDKNLTINVKVDGRGMPLPVSMQDPAMVDLRGLTPVIQMIAPVTSINVPVLAELMQGAGMRL